METVKARWTPELSSEEYLISREKTKVRMWVMFPNSYSRGEQFIHTCGTFPDKLLLLLLLLLFKFSLAPIWQLNNDIVDVLEYVDTKLVAK